MGTARRASPKPWLRFHDEPTSPARKTKIVTVISNHDGTAIGQIRWYSQWRQYTFQPFKDTIYSDGCLREIQDRIFELAAARRSS